MDVWAKGLEPSSVVFLGHKQGAGQKMGQPGHVLAPILDAGVTGRTGLAKYTTVPAPNIFKHENFYLFKKT